LSEKPTVLFVCIHNAGRSQMAAGYMRALSGGAVEVRSGGSEPGDQINPMAITAKAEEDIDISRAVPQLMTTERVKDSDAVITVGCGDVCPIFPGKRYEDWEPPDPREKSIDEVRPIRDDIKARVEVLLAELSDGVGNGDDREADNRPVAMRQCQSAQLRAHSRLAGTTPIDAEHPDPQQYVDYG